MLSRSAVERRRAEHELTVPDAAAAAHALDRAGVLLEHAHELLRTLPAFHLTNLRSDAGDANAHYLTRLHYRAAEVGALRVQAGRLLLASDSAIRDVTRSTGEAVAAAHDIARADTLSTTPPIPLLKARLSWEIAAGNGQLAGDLTRSLLFRGWPVYRSVNPIVLALTGRSELLPAPLRLAADHAADVARNTPQVHRLVPDGVRRRQAEHQR